MAESAPAETWKKKGWSFWKSVAIPSTVPEMLHGPSYLPAWHHVGSGRAAATHQQPQPELPFSTSGGSTTQFLTPREILLPNSLPPESLALLPCSSMKDHYSQHKGFWVCLAAKAAHCAMRLDSRPLSGRRMIQNLMIVGVKGEREDAERVEMCWSLPLPPMHPEPFWDAVYQGLGQCPLPSPAPSHHKSGNRCISSGLLSSMGDDMPLSLLLQGHTIMLTPHVVPGAAPIKLLWTWRRKNGDSGTEISSLSNQVTRQLCEERAGLSSQGISGLGMCPQHQNQEP